MSEEPQRIFSPGLHIEDGSKHQVRFSIPDPRVNFPSYYYSADATRGYVAVEVFRNKPLGPVAIEKLGLLYAAAKELAEAMK